MSKVKFTRERPRVSKSFNGVGRTEQCHKAKCDINNVIKRYMKTGTLAQRMGNGLYGDFTNVSDFQVSLNRVNDAIQDFQSLPSSIRKRFGNDPAMLIEFISDDSNYQEAVNLGLIPKADTPTANEPPDEVVPEQPTLPPATQED